MKTLRRMFGLSVGYSENIVSNATSLAATRLGTPIVEKLYTLDQYLPGPDNRNFLEPSELTDMIE